MIPPHSQSHDPRPAGETVIAPSRGWLRLPWREFWEYRDLLVILVRRDFLARYKQTLLGPLWFILQPLLLALVMSLAFHRVAGLSTGNIPPFLFTLCGLLPWGYFAQNVTTGSATFTANTHLFGKVYFPRLIVPVSGVLSNFYALGLQFFVFLLFTLGYAAGGTSLGLSWNALLILPLFALTAVLSFGVSLLFAASSAKYRDLTHLTPLLLQLWLFVSPVFYPLEHLLNDPRLSWLAWINPMAPIVEGTRIALLSTSAWSQTHSALLVVATITSLLIALLGMIAFSRAERTVVDTV